MEQLDLEPRIVAAPQRAVAVVSVSGVSVSVKGAISRAS